MTQNAIHKIVYCSIKFIQMVKVNGDISPVGPGHRIQEPDIFVPLGLGLLHLMA